MTLHNENGSAPAAEILTEIEVAARYQVPPASVTRWRRSRTGPPYFYAGRHVRYRLADLREWEASEAAMSKRLMPSPAASEVA